MNEFTECNSRKRHAITSEAVDSEINDNQIRIHRYAGGDIALVDGRFHKIEIETPDILVAPSENARGLDEEQLDEAERMSDRDNIPYEEALYRLGYVNRDMNKQLSDYELAVKSCEIFDYEKEKRSEQERKAAAKAILLAFKKLGNYSSDCGLIKCVESNHPDAKNIDVRRVSKKAMEHFHEANRLFLEYSGSDVMKNIVGFDYDQKDENGESLYSDPKVFISAIRQKYYPSTYSKAAVLERNRTKSSLKKIVDQQDKR